ncbi:HpcH/HpaI aldolase/citrate lyase family protein [Erythrobacter litoralis]|uniref:Citrate lyase beta chain n=1 Tax=Erythrobacter litoralis (strain HTCC2594) TaxID=314225 RepID=Q2NDR5_ERYLH|nr:CoA ester lyase [Erythrobacter litoralis]ABC62176.1 citrate lyase beta chain [Erythrobacter litoralis HTCC2594]
MAHRSWLLVPADNDAKLAKVPAVGADVVVLDLAAVAERNKLEAREHAVTFMTKMQRQLTAKKPFAQWVRINPIGSPHWKDDLIAAMAQKPAGIVLPRAMGPQQVQMLAAEIYELEQGGPAAHNSTRILPQVGDAPEAALMISDFAKDPHPRIIGLSWDAGALAAASHMNTVDNDAIRAIRAQLLLTAKARGLLAIESPSGLVKRQEALEAVVNRARINGFDGMMARHPAQIAAIDKAFAPTEEELVAARAILSAFELHPEAQVLTVDGRAVDRIGLERARRLLDAG